MLPIENGKYFFKCAMLEVTVRTRKLWKNIQLVQPRRSWTHVFTSVTIPHLRCSPSTLYFQGRHDITFFLAHPKSEVKCWTSYRTQNLPKNINIIKLPPILMSTFSYTLGIIFYCPCMSCLQTLIYHRFCFPHQL